MTERWQDGPWEAVQITSTGEWVVAVTEGDHRFTLSGKTLDEPTARLIAAAPSVTKAAEDFLEIMTLSPLEFAAAYGPDANQPAREVECAEKLSAALAKARPPSERSGEKS